MKKIQSAGSIKQSTQDLFKKIVRYHYVFSICLGILGIGLIAYNINEILNHPQGSVEGSQQIGFSDKFDTQTIERIDKFKYRDETTLPPTPSGRVNPFIE